MSMVEYELARVLNLLDALERRVAALEPCPHDQGWSDVGRYGQRQQCNRCHAIRAVGP